MQWRLNKRNNEYKADGPTANHRRVSDETENKIYTVRGFREKNQCVTTYEHTTKNLSYFSAKHFFGKFGIYTHPLNVLTLYI